MKLTGLIYIKTALPNCTFINILHFSCARFTFLLTERNEFSISVVTNALSWFDVGLWNYKPPVTSFQYSFMALAGVTWTLRWEWIFYFTLPLLFIFKKWSFELTISLFAFSLYFLPGFTNDAYLWSYFFGGMLCSEIKDRIIITKKQLTPYWHS